MDDMSNRDAAAHPGMHPGNGDNPRRRTPWDTVDGRVISLISRKGGVGKTTSAVNLGAALALCGHTVLVVGVDPQCGVCRSLGTAPDELSTGLGEIFSSGIALTELVQPSPLRDLFFVSPRIVSLDDEEQYLAGFETSADDFVREIDQARILYDTILIDCPPNLGPVTRAALMASDSYLVPVQAEELCRSSVEDLLDFVGDFRLRAFEAPTGEAGEAMRPLTLEGLFLTMTSTRTRMGRHVAAKVAEDFAGSLLDAHVPRTTRLSEMALRGKPAVIYDRRSPGSRAYFDLADELVYRFRQEREAAGPETEPEEAADSETSGSESRIDGEIAGAERIADPGVGGGLDRFLAELGGARELSTRIPAFEEPASPEMVSLDDLLAEEEDGNGDSEGDEWSEGSWSSTRRPH